MRVQMEDSQLSTKVCLCLLFLTWGSLASADQFRRTDVKVVGAIDYGQPTGPVKYTGKPKFAAFEFNARPGDRIEVSVESKHGAMKAYLTDAKFQSITGGGKHFSWTIAQDSQPASYYIAVTEKDRKPAVFTVDLERPSNVEKAKPTASVEYLACGSDSECVAVDRAGCCHNGYKDAVNKTRIAAYEQSNACQDKHTMCAMFIIKDDRVAACNTATHQCEMVNAKR